MLGFRQVTLARRVDRGIEAGGKCRQRQLREAKDDQGRDVGASTQAGKFVCPWTG